MLVCFRIFKSEPKSRCRFSAVAKPVDKELEIIWTRNHDFYQNSKFC